MPRSQRDLHFSDCQIGCEAWRCQLGAQCVCHNSYPRNLHIASLYIPTVLLWQSQEKSQEHQVWWLTQLIQYKLYEKKSIAQQGLTCQGATKIIFLKKKTKEKKFSARSSWVYSGPLEIKI